MTTNIDLKASGFKRNHVRIRATDDSEGPIDSDLERKL
jgi:hypothetical protein